MVQAVLESVGERSQDRRLTTTSDYAMRIEERLMEQRSLAIRCLRRVFEIDHVELLIYLHGSKTFNYRRDLCLYIVKNFYLANDEYCSIVIVKPMFVNTVAYNFQLVNDKYCNFTLFKSAL